MYMHYAIKVETSISLYHFLGQFSRRQTSDNPPAPPRTHTNTPQETTPHANWLPVRQFARYAKSCPQRKTSKTCPNIILSDSIPSAKH